MLSVVLLAAATQPTGISNARDLPSLKIAWHWEGDVDHFDLLNGKIYILNGNNITALNASTGHVYWKKEIGPADALTNGLVATPRSVAVGMNESVVLLNPDTGEILRTTEVGGDVVGLLGPQLLVEVSHDKTSELLKIDDVSGAVTNRKTMPRLLNFMIDGNTIIAKTYSDDDEPTHLIGLNLEYLSEKWTLTFPGYVTLVTIHGKLYVSHSPEDENATDSVFVPLYSDTGKVGEPLPYRKEAQLSSSGDQWEFQYVSDNKDGSSTVRRNELASGKVLWEASIPGRLETYLLDDHGNLFVHSGSGKGRGTLIVIDWKTGKIIRKAYGLHQPGNLILQNGLMIATTYRDGLFAFSATEFGPPESQQKNVEEEVIRILTAKKLTEDCWWEDTDAAVKDLEDLGPDALPVILRELPNLSAPAVDVAARVFQGSTYQQGAPALAARLPELHGCSDLGWARNNPTIAVLQSLAKIGDHSQIAAVNSVLQDKNQGMDVRREAFVALASMGDSEVAQILDSTIDSLTPKSHLWWNPPDPGKYIERFGTRATREEIQNVNDHDIEKWSWLMRARGSKRLHYQNHDIYLFPYEKLGGEADLWLIERDPSGKSGPAKFLSISAHSEKIVHDEVRYDVTIEGQTLIITLPDGSKKGIDLGTIDLDTDQDGLPDLVERRIHSDPLKNDTDGNGEKDSTDLSPNSHGSPANDNQKITAAILQQFFAFHPQESHPMSLAIIVSDFSLDWQGLEGPIVSLSEAEDESFLQDAGYNGAPHIMIKPVTGVADEDHPRPKINPGEVLYDLTIYRGGLDASGYYIVVRKIAEKWYIKQIELSWVS